VTRYLIVNADDFGMSRGVNDAIARAHEEGILTSASLLVRHPLAEEAAAYAQAHPELSVGLHVDLGEWVYSADGGWTALYERAADGDIAREVSEQLAEFRRLMGRDPTHVDSHQHVHWSRGSRRSESSPADWASPCARSTHRSATAATSTARTST
jgi:predicted glycoside hydrolase/deacetylase ChbG (UPF0249 family)